MNTSGILVLYHTYAIPSGKVTPSAYYGLAVASPYVEMTRKQDDGSNQCISVYMAILSPGNKC